MSDDSVRQFIQDCQGMSRDETIAAHHTVYYDETMPHVRKAFEQMGKAD